MKDIVIFYSLEENTAEAAKMIASELGVEAIRLQTAKKLPEGGAKFMVGGAQVTFGFCPKLEAIAVDIKEYDRIILGTPIWASKCAPAINSFLKQYQVADKIAAVFTCSGGGDNDKCILDLQKKLPQLQNTVALADRGNKMASENGEKIKRFVEEIKNGK